MRALTRLFLLFVLLALMASGADGRIVISKVSPIVGPTTGGTEVRLEGSGFFGSCTGGPCEDRSLSFGDVPAASFHVQSDNLVIATTPPRPEPSYWYPVVATIQVGSEDAGFTFYYSDVRPTPPLDDFERVLLPAYNCFLKGAHGSEWCSTLTAFNDNQESAIIYPVYPDPDGGVVAALALPPARIFKWSLLRSIAGSFTETAPVSARLIFIDPEHSEGLHLNLRLFDRSRTSMTWGTNVPVVRERDLFQQTIEIFPVPLAKRFRLSLRVYDPGRNPNAAVAVRFFGTASGELLATRFLNLHVLTRGISTNEDVSFPGIAEIVNLTGEVPELLQLGSEESLRIEIVPVSSDLKFWAMVSVTNDETQHVTLLTPTSSPPSR